MEFRKVQFSSRTPDGCRLATVEEIINNFNKLKSRRILNDMDTLRVLDGITRGSRKVDLSEWEWENMLVLGQFPMEVSRTGSGVFRNDLYSNIALDDGKKGDALRLSLLVGDIEVISWLRYSTTQDHLERLRQIFQETEAQLDDRGFSLIVRMLLLDSPETPDERVVEDILSYASKTMDVDCAVCVTEIVLNIFKMNVVLDSAIAKVAKLLSNTQPRWEANLIGMLTKLLSASTHTLAKRIPIIDGRFEKLLTEAVHRGYVSLVEGLLDLRESVGGHLVENVDDDGKTLLHYTAEWERSKDSEAVSDILLKAYNDSFGLDFVKKLDKHGRSVLHLASFCGRPIFCKNLVSQYELQLNAVDCWQQNLLHYAAKGDFGEKLVQAFSNSFANLIHKKNKKGKTPLHVAAVYGKIEMVKAVIDSLSGEDGVKASLKDSDYAGRTPLLLAAGEGHIKVVKKLLMHGSDPLEERDIDGNTALHYAVMSVINARELVDTLLQHCQSEKEQALLLWVSAARIGTADEIDGLKSNIKDYLREKKEEIKHVNLLKAAASAVNSRLTWELLNRGADIADLPDNAEFNGVKTQIEKFSVQGTDRPTLQDTLGRDVLAECIAARFLNPYIKSAITVCISGGNGMGKTSLLNLIKAQLLTISAQLAFPFLSQYEDFPGARKMSPSPTGERMCQKICKGIAKLTAKGKASLVYFLEKYRPEHVAVYRSLACMDVNQLLKANEQDSKSPGESMGEVPRVLTVDFNVGNYRGRHEAWAGLALEITEQIEASMTRAQWFSTCWRNARRNNSKNFYFMFIFTWLLWTILAGCIGWTAWKLLDRSSVKDLKYGSIPATAITIVWASMSALYSLFRPVSQQMSGYFSLPDYSEWIGYQQKVIRDIQFLKDEIGRKPSIIFSFIDCFGLWTGNIDQTSVPKYGLAPADKLRIIAFVDDLDHCEDEVILQVLWAINLVFRVCEINVILAMDKNTIEEALKNSSHNQEEGFVDKYISKIIQLPVNLPDPEDDEWDSFLEAELEREPSLSHVQSNTGVQTDPEGDEGREQGQAGVAAEEGREQGQAQGGAERREQGQAQGGADEEQAQAQGGADEEQGQAQGRADEEQGQAQGGADEEQDQAQGRADETQGQAQGGAQGQGISSFWKNVLSWLKWILNILYLVACNDRDQERLQPRRPTLPLTEYKPLTKRVRDLREMLMTSYTSAEVQTFNRLKVFATENQKVPREWKNYLNYHKFARIVVSKRARKGNTNYPEGWEMEFVAWTFACWQWKHEINVLIQDWGMYLHTEGNSEQPSLKDIVVNYIEQRWPQQPQNGGREIDESILVKALDTIHNISLRGIHGFKELSFKGDMRHVPLSIQGSAMSHVPLSIQGRGYSPMEIARFIKEEKKERERWNKLREALDTIKDVSMECIQRFQQFRFHCQPKNLSRAKKS